MTPVEPYCNGIGCPERLKTTCHHYKDKINYKKETHWGKLPYDKEKDSCSFHQDYEGNLASKLDQYLKKNGQKY